MEEVVVQKISDFSAPEKEVHEWDVRGLTDWINMNFPVGIRESDLTTTAGSATEAPVADSLFGGLSAAQFAVAVQVGKCIRDAYQLKATYENADAIKSIERYTILSAIDKLWQEHLYYMDSLRNSIGLRAYGQRDPLIEYKAEAFKSFEELMVSIKTEICHNIFRSASSLMAFENFLRNVPQQTMHQSTSAFGGTSTGTSQPPQAGQKAPRGSDLVSEAAEAVEKAKPVRAGPKVGRNDPCPCGSGKKYKQCCGR
jgi:preprotein translocase subunit SecA